MIEHLLLDHARAVGDVNSLPDAEALVGNLAKTVSDEYDLIQFLESAIFF